MNSDIWSKWAGAEHVKRMLEIAAVGNHTVCLKTQGCLDDGLHYALPSALAIGVTMHVMPVCPCGCHGDNELACQCSVELLARHDIENVQYRSYSMHAIMPRVSYEKLTSERTRESLTEVQERIAKAKKELSKVTPNLDAACQSLMKAAARQLTMTQTQYENTINVARSIAALGYSKCVITPAHLAEAIQYRVRVWMGDPK